MSMPIVDVRPGAFYWVCERRAPELEIARITAVFGAEKDFWTVIRSGSEINHMVDEFDFVAEAIPPNTADYLKVVP